MKQQDTVPVMANIVPWNEAILRGIRTFKTLHFNWSYRGPLVLYNSHGDPDADDIVYGATHDIKIDLQSRGFIVGVVDVVDCVDAREEDGHWHVELRNPRRVDPVPYKPTRGSIRISRMPRSSAPWL
ncbi:MAG TPA: hypothetical protein VF761_17140 [Gemmatimonadaceae bacterium]